MFEQLLLQKLLGLPECKFIPQLQFRVRQVYIVCHIAELVFQHREQVPALVGRPGESPLQIFDGRDLGIGADLPSIRWPGNLDQGQVSQRVQHQQGGAACGRHRYAS